jgi:hypothetical protein
MSEITTVGLDLAKTAFQIHGADVAGQAVLRKTSAGRAARLPFTTCSARRTEPCRKNSGTQRDEHGFAGSITIVTDRGRNAIVQNSVSPETSSAEKKSRPACARSARKPVGKGKPLSPSRRRTCIDHVWRAQPDPALLLRVPQHLPCLECKKGISPHEPCTRSDSDRRVGVSRTRGRRVRTLHLFAARKENHRAVADVQMRPARRRSAPYHISVPLAIDPDGIEIERSNSDRFPDDPFLRLQHVVREDDPVWFLRQGSGPSTSEVREALQTVVDLVTHW